jgi:GT2 family glycosyltransferase
MIDVSCITINYNSSSYTIELVKSIIKNTEPSLLYKIIVVDNASEKKDYLVLKEGLNKINNQHIKLVRSTMNIGFGGGNMFGVQYLEASKYLAFINNDCVVYEGVLNGLKLKMDNDESIGVCSPQMLDGNLDYVPTVSTFPSVKKELFGRRLLEKLFPKSNSKKRKRYTEPVKVDLVIGSFMFFRAGDFYAIGGFDTNLFLYYEEADICFRLKKYGKSTYLFPSFTYLHHINISTGSNNASPIQIEHYLSLLYVVRKNNGFLCYSTLLNILRIKILFKSIHNPKKLSLLAPLHKGAPLSLSLKQKQKIQL